MTDKPILCLYHADCVDGFTAAWVVRWWFGGNVELHEARYNQGKMPSVTDRHVLLVDFSYPRKVLEAMTAHAKSITVIDHHATALQELATFVYPCDTPDDMQLTRDMIVRHWADANPNWEAGDPAPIRVVFDVERSGAQLTWDFFFGGSRPLLVDYVGDRDLWKFALPDARAVSAWIASHKMTPSDWSLMHEKLSSAAGRVEVVAQGEAILRKQRVDIDKQIELTVRSMLIGGHDVPVANLPRAWDSDGCHAMLEAMANVPFVASYFDTPDGRKFSLRSDTERGGLDVSQIAKQYGGGGHKQAAGFLVPYDKLGELR